MYFTKLLKFLDRCCPTLEPVRWRFNWSCHDKRHPGYSGWFPTVTTLIPDPLRRACVCVPIRLD